MNIFIIYNMKIFRDKLNFNNVCKKLKNILSKLKITLNL